MLQKTLDNLRKTMLYNPAGFKISRALFAKAAAELQNFAGFTQSFFCRIATDPLHGRIPGGNAPRCIHGKDTVGHGINNLIYKICVPDFMAFRLHGYPSTKI
jgi:hypothetical protein